MNVLPLAQVRRVTRGQRTVRDYFDSVGREVLRDVEGVAFPSSRWRNDPVGFARDVLGIELWSAQVEILESIRDNRNTTVRSGHKCGKSTAIAVAALWFDASFPRARVLCTAVKATQVEQIVWKEIRRLYRGSRVPLGGVLNETARTGLVHDDGRQVWGATARTGEGLAGISGPNVLILADEASGIGDPFFEVLGSSLAGSGGVVRKCYISNPTKTNGEFYKSHTTNAALFKCIHISSEDTPNARGGKVIPGLAGPEWIAEKKIEYGEDSYAYRVRVKGEFVSSADGRIISLDAIATAEEAWDETPDAGPLQIGIDPAGEGMTGDETAIAVRLGKKIVTVLAWRSLSVDAIVENVLGLLTDYRPKATGKPRIVVDAEGGIGWNLVLRLRAAIDVGHLQVDLEDVRAGKVFWGSPEFEKIRDALWGQTREWIRSGGAIPTDVKLAEELNAPSFVEDKNKRFRATDKDALRKALGRSTDRADAVCLAIWGYASVGEEVPPPKPRTTGDAYEHANTEIDPYATDGLGTPRGDGVYS